MDALTAWWAGLRRDRRLMLIAIAVSFVSQFFTYANEERAGVFAMDSHYNTGVSWWISQWGGTGWQLDPLAAVILAGLAAVYLWRLHESAWWSKWGYWLSVFLFYFMLLPGRNWAFGALMGFAALIVAAWAAWVHRALRKAAAAAK